MADGSIKSKQNLLHVEPRTPQRTGNKISISLRNNSGYLDKNSFNAAQFDDDGDTNDAYSLSQNTILDGNLDSKQPIKFRTELLFTQFYEILQAHSSDAEIFEILQDITQACTTIADELEKEIKRGAGGLFNTTQREAHLDWLKNEINIWKLIYVLYHDRIMVQMDGQDEEMNNIMPALGVSEKELIAQLFIVNSTLREYQLVVDWLEMSYVRPESTILAHTSERSVAWENTLFQLQNKHLVYFNKNTDMVASLDPDAPVREKQPLHTLDEEDNLKLAKGIFTELRKGDIDGAISLCRHFGQTWRAAILEGWRLHEDPNYEIHHISNEKVPIEGNPRRDLWKKCAWLMADSKKFDEYTRGIAGALCGHLESLKSLLSNSYQDLLWAYLKVQIDIRVESELRSSCMRVYHPMPDEYWNAKMTLEQIFNELLVAKDAAVRDYAQSHFCVIQQHLILDTSTELLAQMCCWVTETKNISIHKLRLFTHIVLFMRQIGRTEQEHNAERIITAYVEALIERGEPQLVAFYTSTLPRESQVHIYSKFLQKIQETNLRSAALDAAQQMGLDVENITTSTVETIREWTPNENEFVNIPQIGNILEFDQKKISALEWLTYLPMQRGELFWQANAMIRQFLTESKMECVRNVHSMVPRDSVNQLLKIYGSKQNFPYRIDCSIKEYLCYKSYLEAIDCFENWIRLYHNHPQPPKNTNINSNFTERIAMEHKEANYRTELQRWQSSVLEQTKLTTDALYNILLFPEKGFLIDNEVLKGLEKSEQQQEMECRRLQLNKLRSILIPEVVLLLHQVLHQTEDYESCIKLADEIASDELQLYKVYTTDKMAEFLAKIAESSQKLLDKKLDPWGYPLAT